MFNKLNLIMFRMDFQSGEKVYMMLDNEFVGIGCVCRTDPDSTCSGTKIGQGNVSLLVEDCLKDVVLPFSTMDTTYLQSSLWSNVCWPKLLLRPFAREENLIGSYSDVEQEDHVDPMIMDAIPLTSPEFEMSIRESWKNQRVLLKDETMMQILNEGVILYVFPYECVNFQELGDDCVGVGIERENASAPFETMSQVGSITLVKWPIKQMTMLDGCPLQRYVPLHGMHAEHGHVSNEDNDGYVTNEVNVDPSSRKRRYTFINRIQKERAQPASKLYLSLESIQKVSCIDCCANKCCQLADRDMLMRVRQDFWGQTQQSRTNYVYDVLSICCQRNDSNQKMRYEFRLNGVTICCKAWYEMHGIPKTSFYLTRKSLSLVCVNTCMETQAH